MGSYHFRRNYNNNTKNNIDKDQSKRRLIKRIIIFSIIIPVSLGIVMSIAFGTYFMIMHNKWKSTIETGLLANVEKYHSQLDRILYPEKYPNEKQAKEGLSVLVGMGSVVYDDTGEKILGKFSNADVLYASVQKVSPKFISALVSSEDREFYNHDGVNIKALIAATIQNIKARSFIRGASTITMQLARMLSNDREVSFRRKMNEVFSAWSIEKAIPNKDSIMNMYINLTYFGHGATGIETASEIYFGKKAIDLDWGESALLAGVIANPSHYSPFNNPKKAMARHYRVLKGMVESGVFKSTEEADKVYTNFWSTHDFAKLKKNMLKFREKLRQNDSPYIIEYVRRFWEREFGDDKELYTRGYRIYTTINYDMQRTSQEILKKGIDNYRKQMKGLPRLKGKLDKLEGAVIIMNPKTGYIQASIGGYDFNISQFDRVFQAYRQTGSAFKPVVYLSGIEKGDISPYSLIRDQPFSFTLPNGKVWAPKNYGEKYFERDLTLINALKYSSNSIAAQTISIVGESKIREVVKDALNLSEEEANRRYPEGVKSMALGAVAMTPLELAKVYSMIANYGVRVESKLIRSVKDSLGNPIMNFETSNKPNLEKRIISPETAFQLIQMMRAVLENGGTGGGLNLKSRIPNVDIAAKTGTSQRYHDLWFCGITPELCCCVWVGHDENIELNNGGGKVAGPIFADLMVELAKTRTFTQFNPPGTLKRVYICRDSGLLVVENKCKHIDTAYLYPTKCPSAYCPLDHSGTTEDWSKLGGEGDTEFLDEGSLDDELGLEYIPDKKQTSDPNKLSVDENGQIIQFVPKVGDEIDLSGIDDSDIEDLKLPVIEPKEKNGNKKEKPLPIDENLTIQDTDNKNAYKNDFENDTFYIEEEKPKKSKNAKPKKGYKISPEGEILEYNSKDESKTKEKPKKPAPIIPKANNDTKTPRKNNSNLEFEEDGFLIEEDTLNKKQKNKHK